MAQSYFLLGFCLSINIMVMIIFFSKKRLPLFENAIYIRLMVMNCLCIFFEFLCNLSSDGLLYDYKEIVVRLFLIGLTFYGSFLTIYTIVVAIEREEKNEIIRNVFLIINAMLCIPIIFLGMDFRRSYVSGHAVEYMVTIQSIYITLAVILLIFKKKTLKKKFIPVLAYIFLSIIGVIINKIDPTISTINCIETFVVLLMFFTIENPDLKMLKEVSLSRDRAEQANRAKSDFLSSMSHEIRTPLNAIVGLSEDITSYKDQVPQEVVEDSEDIMNASQTLLEIVGNILDINKIESNKMEIIDTCYNFKEEIMNMCKVTSTRIGDKHIDFNLRMAEDIPYELIGDKGKVKEVVNNLLTNSIKYTEEGTIDLTIKCVNRIEDNETTLMITCQDTGRGIKADDINKLFTKFERLDVERNTTAEGTGLGLAITKSLIEMMGGNINVQSQFGKGSIFVVQIPQKISQFHAPEGVVEEVQDDSNFDDYKGKRILIVDDNNLNIKVAKKTLQDFDVIIDEASNGQQCIDKVVNGNEYDLILMDIMMPVMSGETALLKLKENPHFDIPTIALTADAVSGAKEKYIDSGFVDYLAKPFTKQQIKEKLDLIFKRDRKMYEDKWKSSPEIVVVDSNNSNINDVDEVI